MKALFVHGDASLASTRVRVLDLLPHLAPHDWEATAVPNPRSPFRLRELLASSEADAVVVQKKTPTLARQLAWRARRAPLVFDFDDAVQFRPRPRDGSFESRTRRRRFARALHGADAFACGNEYLASFCRPSGRPVLVAPSAVPLDVPRRSPRREDGPLRVGWIGAGHNLRELEALGDALAELARRLELVVVAICDRSPALPGVAVEHVPWSLETQHEALAGLDVGLMPLADSPWSRGKCAYKLLQYLAAEVPAVASPVGANADLVEDGVNGLLAADPPAFARAIESLAGDPDRACALARRGRQTAEGFSYPAVAAAWAAFLDDLVGR